MSELGNTISSLRKNKNLSLKKLSEISGLTAGQLSKIETESSNNCTPVALVKVAKALGVPVESIFKDEAIVHPAKKNITDSTRTTFAVSMVEKAKMEALASQMRERLGCSVRWTDVLHRMIDDIDVEKAYEIFSNYVDPSRK